MTTIFSVGREIPGDGVEYVDLESNASLLDADVVLFWPYFGSFKEHCTSHNGRPCLTRDRSFAIKETMLHWRKETGDALKVGKNVILFLTPMDQMFAYTGDSQESGTGRNVRVTNIVAPATNYDWLPREIGNMTAAAGHSVAITPDGNFLATYWDDLGGEGQYHLYIDASKGTPVLLTKAGHRLVGQVFRGAPGEGSLLMIPPVEFDEQALSTKTGTHWNAEGRRFGARFVGAVVGLDKALRMSLAATAEPTWASSNEYMMESESALRADLLATESQARVLLARSNDLKTDLEREGGLRRLLYEKGRPLEEEVLNALTVLGFEAHRFKDSGSEFDVLFTSPEGRFLGEVEGKDAKPINIEKLRQLEMNIHEDFARDEITAPAKGVLFGNAFRLVEPGKRDGFFTEKCLTQAKRGGQALVRTPDLFGAARHVKNSNDQDFARQCRLAIAQTAGAVVVWPSSAPNK